ncbi:hypothetical protein CGRA01v4_06212 [Colletotrichum graminicola]|uniref:Uncharacterized protein n=1 Tax=Colletotrichum graminicola (strain M1.001 / M2 / FGSC 10212) TaxID=645133 RepID=E3QX31_COLGM|nr:uncharacterized protein GLRG_10563 [Colletotrichum graminicola M1.001]EFQ35419.1 hypothetical protein GLRG_10563 [Colletotrichum graminicola M1.001]WDK14930.1 hypothetical protein CGRA01v4_06212 [Colletotrichum graminicola]
MSRMSHSSRDTNSGVLTKRTRGDTTMARTRRSHSPSTRSRSSSAGPREHRRPSIKTAAVLVAAVAVATICLHKLWPRSSHKDHWEPSPASSAGRLSRRRNAIRDRHNGYLDYDDHNVFDRNDHVRSDRRRRLPEREHYPAPSHSDGRSRGYGSDSDGDSYHSDEYLPSPSERFSNRRSTIEGDRRSKSRGISALDNNEIVRYERQSNMSFEEERPQRPQYNEAVADWSRRGSQLPSSLSDEQSYKGESEYADRRSRRRPVYH